MCVFVFTALSACCCPALLNRTAAAAAEACARGVNGLAHARQRLLAVLAGLDHNHRAGVQVKHQPATGLRYPRRQAQRLRSVRQKQRRAVVAPKEQPVAGGTRQHARRLLRAVLAHAARGRDVPFLIKRRDSELAKLDSSRSWRSHAAIPVGRASRPIHLRCCRRLAAFVDGRARRCVHAPCRRRCRRRQPLPFEERHRRRRVPACGTQCITEQPALIVSQRVQRGAAHGIDAQQVLHRARRGRRQRIKSHLVREHGLKHEVLAGAHERGRPRLPHRVAASRKDGNFRFIERGPGVRPSAGSARAAMGGARPDGAVRRARLKKMTQPSAHQSTAAPNGCPSTISGAMYWGVPTSRGCRPRCGRLRPPPVAAAGCRGRARPAARPRAAHISVPATCMRARCSGAPVAASSSCAQPKSHSRT